MLCGSQFLSTVCELFMRICVVMTTKMGCHIKIVSGQINYAERGHSLNRDYTVLRTNNVSTLCGQNVIVAGSVGLCRLDAHWCSLKRVEAPPPSPSMTNAALSFLEPCVHFVGHQKATFQRTNKRGWNNVNKSLQIESHTDVQRQKPRLCIRLYIIFFRS